MKSRTRLVHVAMLALLILAAVALPRTSASAAPASAKPKVALLADGLAGTSVAGLPGLTVTVQAGEEVAFSAHATHLARNEGILILDTASKQEVNTCFGHENPCPATATGQDGEMVVYRAAVIKETNGKISYVTKSNKIRVQWKHLTITVSADLAHSDPQLNPGVVRGDQTDAGAWSAGSVVSLHAAAPNGIGSNWAQIVLTDSIGESANCQPGSSQPGCETAGSCVPDPMRGCSVGVVTYLDLADARDVRNKWFEAFAVDAGGHVLAVGSQTFIDGSPSPYLRVVWVGRHLAFRITSPGTLEQDWAKSNPVNVPVTVPANEKVTMQAWLGSPGDKDYDPLHQGETFGLYDETAKQDVPCRVVQLGPPDNGPACETTVSFPAGEMHNYSAIRKTPEGITGREFGASLAWKTTSPCGPSALAAHLHDKQSSNLSICLFASQSSEGVDQTVTLTAYPSEDLPDGATVEIDGTDEATGKARPSLHATCAKDSASGVTECIATDTDTYGGKIDYTARIVQSGSELAHSSVVTVTWDGYQFSGLKLHWDIQSTCSPNAPGACDSWHDLTGEDVTINGQVCGDPYTARWWFTYQFVYTLQSAPSATDDERTAFTLVHDATSPSGTFWQPRYRDPSAPNGQYHGWFHATGSLSLTPDTPGPPTKLIYALTVDKSTIMGGSFGRQAMTDYSIMPIQQSRSVEVTPYDGCATWKNDSPPS